MRRLNLRCISPQSDLLSDISFRQSKISIDSTPTKKLVQYDKIRNNNRFSVLRDVQMGSNKSEYSKSIHVEGNDQWWVDVDFNKPMSLMIICKNNYGDKTMDMKDLADMTITDAYFGLETYDAWLDNIGNY